MKTIVVGDLHGQIHIAEKALELGLPTIFIGDYLDSFTVSVENQILLLQVVLDAVKEGQAVALYGNHELSYMDDFMRCSGFKAATQAHVMHMDLSPLLYWVKREGFLLSHAGVSQRMLDATDETIEEYLQAGQYADIGYTRGGRSPVGGLLWCDWNQEFQPVEGTPQIVGHTRGNGIRQKGNSYCIDCLEDTKPQVVAIEDGKLEIVDL